MSTFDKSEGLFGLRSFAAKNPKIPADDAGRTGQALKSSAARKLYQQISWQAGDGTSAGSLCGVERWVRRFGEGRHGASYFCYEGLFLGKQVIYRYKGPGALVSCCRNGTVAVKMKL